MVFLFLIIVVIEKLMTTRTLVACSDAGVVHVWGVHLIYTKSRLR